MKFLEALRKPRSTVEPSEAQIARIAAKAARNIVTRDAALLTPQTRASVLRGISEAEQTDLARLKPREEL